MSFNLDNVFSKHKDLLLKDYWKTVSFEGRFVLTGSEFLQKTHGIDVILQTKNDKSDIKIDTKHVRGNYNSLFMEEMSCSVAGREKTGWLLKADGHPDYIIHVMNPLCHKCYKNCDECSLPIRKNMIGFITKFSPLRKWFISNKDKYKLLTMQQINKTTGRNVPIKTLTDTVNTRVCNLG